MESQMLNCEKARDISIVSTLEKLGHFPKRKTEKEAWFLSPFRSETQASFKVDLKINRWYDHGMGKGGNIIDFIMALYNFSVSQALTFLGGNVNSFSFHQQTDFNEEQKPYLITKVKSLENLALIDYIKNRSISVDIAKQYCKEIYYLMYKKNYFAVAFKNNSDGYEIRNKYFKGCLGGKDITHIKNGALTLIVFEGFIDFLSYQTIYEQRRTDDDYLILNSISCVNQIGNLIQSYQQVITCLDNDDAGIKATRFLSKNYKNVVSCSFVYKGFKDLNEYLKSKQKGKKIRKV